MRKQITKLEYVGFDRVLCEFDIDKEKGHLTFGYHNKWRHDMCDIQGDDITFDFYLSNLRCKQGEFVGEASVKLHIGGITIEYESERTMKLGEVDKYTVLPFIYSAIKRASRKRVTFCTKK